MPAQIANDFPGLGAERDTVFAAAWRDVEVADLKRIAQPLKHLRVNMTGDHQIATRIIIDLQPSCRRANQANGNKGDTGAGSGDAGISAFAAAQGGGMLRDERMKTVAEKLGILFVKLSLRNDPHSTR